MYPACTVSGNDGIVVRQRDGSMILIGTRKPAEFLAALSGIVIVISAEEQQ